VVEIFKSDTFDRWLKRLPDARARARIQVRIDRLQMGNPGDVRPVGEGVSEMRVDYGPGYRLYFVRRGLIAVVLLCGGDKSTQAKDILLAKAIAIQWKEVF
jgi:putative addiction module killer protein